MSRARRLLPSSCDQTEFRVSVPDADIQGELDKVAGTLRVPSSVSVAPISRVGTRTLPTCTGPSTLTVRTCPHAGSRVPKRLTRGAARLFVRRGGAPPARL